MAEPANIMAVSAVILLLVSFMVWASPFGRPLLPLMTGGTAVSAGHQITAAYLLLAAVGLSAVAAVLAVAVWF